jgi:hypothetical protein
MPNHTNYYYYRCCVCSTKYQTLTKEVGEKVSNGVTDHIVHYCSRHKSVEQPNVIADKAQVSTEKS